MHSCPDCRMMCECVDGESDELFCTHCDLDDDDETGDPWPEDDDEDDADDDDEDED